MSDSKKKSPGAVPLDVPLPALDLPIPLAEPSPNRGTPEGDGTSVPEPMLRAPIDVPQGLTPHEQEPVSVATEALEPVVEIEAESPLASTPGDPPKPVKKAKPTSRVLPPMKPIVSADPYLNGLRPLRQSEFSEATARYVGLKAVGPMKLMASRAMAPLAPRDLIRVVYQLIFDEDDRIAAAALRSFKNFDDRVLSAVLGEGLPPTVLLLLSRTLLQKSIHLERVLLNRETPDQSFVYVAAHSGDANILTIVAGNQERMLREPDIIRGLASNLATPRVEVDRAVDFLVREGVFLEDVPLFNEAFNRLGKAEVMEALKNVEISHTLLTEEEQLLCAKHGLSADQLLLGGMRDISSLLEAEELDLQSRRRQRRTRTPFRCKSRWPCLAITCVFWRGCIPRTAWWPLLRFGTRKFARGTSLRLRK